MTDQNTVKESSVKLKRGRQPDPSVLTRMVEGEISLGGCLNKRFFDLLAAIKQSGSINKAAKEAGMSYKGAWEMIDRAAQLSPRELIATSKGGHEGGGTKLTETGDALLQAYIRTRQKHQAFLDLMSKELREEEPLLQQWFKGMFIRLSARNQWLGRVLNVRSDKVDAEVLIELKGAQRISAKLTRRSIEELRIQSGREVLVMIKVPSVMIIPSVDENHPAGVNHLVGSIVDIKADSDASEVSLKLAGDITVVGTTETAMLHESMLSIGKRAVAIFDGGSVVLAVPKEQPDIH